MSATDIKIAGSRLPIIRYVHLVEDATDAIRMGSTGSNVYTNAQLAWNAAVAIITANPTYNVVIQVGVTTAAGVGGVTIATLDSFSKISFVGLSNKVSVIGNITITTGSPTNSDRGRIKNITVGNFVNTAGANLSLTIQDSITGNLTVNNGAVLFLFDSYDSRIGDITLTTAIVTSTASLQFINCGSLYVNSITATVNAQVIVNSVIGGPGIQSGNDHPTITFGTVSMTGLLRPIGSEFRNCEFIGTFTFTNSATAGGIAFPLNFDNCKFQGAVALTANSGIVNNVANCNITNSTFFAGLTFSGLRMQPKISFSNLQSITNLSANAVMMNCNFYTTQVATPLINGIGTGCKIFNSTFVGGSFAINNATSVKVTSISNSFDLGTTTVNRVGANIWLVPEDVISTTVTTPGPAATTGQTINIPTNSIVTISTYVSARNTATGVGNGYVLMVRAKNVAGVVTLGTIGNTYTFEDTVAWDATYTVSGTTVRVTVSGAGGTNVDWAITSKINS